MGKRKEKEDKIQISIEMVKKCKEMIAKFGHKIGDYENFLVSIKAMKPDKNTVLQYPNHQMPAYEKAYIEQCEISLSDKFVFEKFKILTSDEQGKQFETGYFCPRSFWDYVHNFNLKKVRY